MASEASSDHLASRMFTPRARSQPVGDRAFRLRRLASVAAFGVAAWLLAGFTFPGLPGSLWAAALGAAALAQGSRAAGGAVVLGLVLAGFAGSPAAGREVVVLLAFALVELARHRPSPNGPGASLGQAALLLVLQGAVGLPTALAAGDGLEAFKTAVGPALAIAAAFLLWVPLTGPAWAGRPARLLGLGLLLALGAGALWRWTGTPLHPAWLGASLLVQGAAWAGGAGAGAGMGLAIGAVWVWSHGSPAAWASLLGLAGLVGGMARPLGRAGVLVGFWFGLLMTTPQVADPWILDQLLVSAGAATLLAALVPKRLLRRWQAAWLGEEEAPTATQVRARVGAELRKVSRLYERMARELEPDGPARPDEAVGQFIQALHGAACQGCPALERCWGREMYTTYWGMVELVGALEHLQPPLTPERLPQRLALRCTRHDRLVRGLNQTLPSFQAGRRTLRDEGAPALLPQQLRALAGLVEAAAARVEEEGLEAEEVEEALRQSLAQVAPVQTVRCTRVGPNRYRVRVRLRTGCPHPGFCQVGLAPVVSRRLGRPYAVWQASCTGGEGKGCRFELLPQRRFRLEVADAALQRAGELHSGDTVARMELADGRVAVLLSDGMGSGLSAWQASRTAVHLLRSFLEAGLAVEPSVQMVNRLLRARTHQVRFATLDLLVVDLYTGQAQFLKLGAAPSLVIRRGEVEVVEAENPPAGAVDGFQTEVQTLTLGPDDRVILASDGLWELGEGHRSEWLAETVAHFRAEEPAVLAELLAARARELCPRGVPDDATVVVARLRPDPDARR